MTARRTSGLMGCAAVLAGAGLCGAAFGDDDSAVSESLSARLLEDASARSSLLGQDLLDDPRFNIGGTIQLRFNANLRQQDAAQSVDDFESGFLIRRARIKLDGEFEFEDSDGTVPWEIETETSRSTGNVFLLDAWFGYETGNWRIRGGQFVPPLTREQLVSNTRRMAVEVSPVTGAFSTTGAGGRTQGVEARWRDDEWSFAVMLSDGDLGGNRSFAQDPGDIAVYARAERKFGDDGWSRFRDFTSERGSSSALLVGAAGLVTVGEADADLDLNQRESFYELIGTADVSYEGDGWNAFVASNILHRSAQGVDDRNRFGVSGHVGAYVTDRVELFTQYSWMTGEDAAGELSTLVVGANNYIVGHTVKLQADVVYSFNPITLAYISTSRALLPDAPGEDGQVVLRAQFQLTF